MAGFSKKNVEQVQRNGKPKESKIIIRYTTQLGQDGTNGSDAFNVQLSPNNITFAAGSYNAIPKSYSVNVYVTRGTTRINGLVLDSSISAGGGASLPSGLSVAVSSNGTINTQLTISTDANLMADSGEIIIPVQYSLDAEDGSTAYDADDWDPLQNPLATFDAVFSWTLGKTGQSTYTLDLSNERGTINADASGNILPGAVRPPCKATLSFGADSSLAGVYYDASWDPGYGVQGLAINHTTGDLIYDQNNVKFNFGHTIDDTILDITIDASYDGRKRGYKVMTIQKALPGQQGPDGQPGEDAVSRWIELSANQVKVDSSGNILPPTIAAYAWKQVGEQMPDYDSSTTIKWAYDSSVTSTVYSSPITVNATKSFMTFKLYLNGTYIGESETVPILKDGIDGRDGSTGRQGAAIRGPVLWDSSSNVNITGLEPRWFYCGVKSSTPENPLEEQFIDVIMHDGNYYVCQSNYQQAANATWSSVSSHWTVADASFNFVAANVILAQNAGIDFLTGNQIYLRDASGNITAGASGGNGISFWAGGDRDASANFIVDSDGNITAKSGTFSGYLQMPYVLIDDLNHNDGSTYVEYIADSRAYIIAYPLAYTSTYQRRLVLPTPSASLNGFMYDIIVYPMLTRMDGAPDVLLKASDNSTIYCVAYAELRASDKFNLTYGRYTITCVPWSYQGTYKWFITSATGGIENIISASSSEYVSTLLATSSDSSKLIYKVQTYTGNSHPSVNNPNQTLFVKPQ